MHSPHLCPTPASAPMQPLKWSLTLSPARTQLLRWSPTQEPSPMRRPQWQASMREATSTPRAPLGFLPGAVAARWRVARPPAAASLSPCSGWWSLSGFADGDSTGQRLQVRSYLVPRAFSRVLGKSQLRYGAWSRLRASVVLPTRRTPDSQAMGTRLQARWSFSSQKGRRTSISGYYIWLDYLQEQVSRHLPCSAALGRRMASVARWRQPSRNAVAECK